MVARSATQAALVVTMVLCASSLMPSAHAEDFFSALFGAFGGRHLASPQIVLPFANEGAAQGDVPRARSYGGGRRESWCP